MRYERVKICPTCDCEYRADVEVCADCGGLLKYPEELGANRWKDEAAGIAQLGPIAAAQLPPSDELVCIRTAQIDWARGLLALLARQEIPLRVEVEKTAPSLKGDFRHWFFKVYVRPQDVEAAMAADQDYVREHMPEFAALHEAGALDLGKCPACGASVAPENRSCPECDLSFIEEDPQKDTPS